MATVPLQHTPTVELDVGQAPLFSATNIEPVRDTGVAEDIQRVGNAQKLLAQVAIKNKEEQDDVVSNDAFNGYQEEADAKVNEYLQLQRGQAVATVDVDQDTGLAITAYDKLIKDLDEIGNKYLETLTNSDQKQIFNDKYSASKRLSKNTAVKHSLKQRRLQLEEDTKANIEMSKKGAINSFESWDDEEGDYNGHYYRGLAEIKRNAELNGRNTDINKGPLSAKYLEDVQAYNKEVMEGVVDQLMELPGGHKLAQDYVKKQKPEELKEVNTELEQSIADKHDDYNVEQCVDAVLSNNSNQNTGDFLDQTKKLMCLKSNHFVNDGTGASVHDGNHSDKVNIAGQTQENNIDTLEKIKNESKFYKLDSNETLINEHEPTHLFAVQHLGVQKADSLYTKAKSSIEIDKTRYKEDATYAKQINEKIINNYNKLISEETNKIYARFGEGEFANSIENDLEIIKKGINYDGNFTYKVDFVTGLRPLNELKDELKATITDPKQLSYALKDLEIKYNKIKNERTQIYNEALNTAKEIAFAEEGGWKNLKDNGIKIENFSESDQELLKKGQPEESNVDTIAELIDNPKEVRDNLPSYSHELSQSDYLGLKQYAKSLQSEDKYIEANGNKDLMKDVMYKNGFEWVYKSKFGGNSADFGAIHTEWVDRIDYAQRISNKKLTRQQKVEILNNVLMDKVNLQGTLGFGRQTNTLTSTVMPDRLDDLFVKVKVKQEDGSTKTEQIFTSEITKEVSIAIMGSLYRRKLPMNQQNIAEEWVKFGKPKTLKQAEEFINANLNYQLAPENLK